VLTEKVFIRQAKVTSAEGVVEALSYGSLRHHLGGRHHSTRTPR
jgi:hypothetical protein